MKNVHIIHFPAGSGDGDDESQAQSNVSYGSTNKGRTVTIYQSPPPEVTDYKDAIYGDCADD